MKLQSVKSWIASHHRVCLQGRQVCQLDEHLGQGSRLCGRRDAEESAGRLDEREGRDCGCEAQHVCCVACLSPRLDACWAVSGLGFSNHINIDSVCFRDCHVQDKLIDPASVTNVHKVTRGIGLLTTGILGR